MIGPRLRPLLALTLGVVATTLAGCEPKYPKCDNDRHCEEHREVCVNGRCQQCRDDAGCKAGERCNGGRCEARPAAGCTDDAACPAGQSCLAGRCAPCSADAQCGEGGRCRAGRCLRRGACATDDDCPEDQDCEQGRCVKAGSSASPPAAACALEPVYFDFNEFALTIDARPLLDRDAECLKRSGARAALLEGHTDPRGTDEYNLALSEKRAVAVRDRLVLLGVDAGRLQVVGKGKLESTSTDEAGWAKDRRVDLEWR